jgi:hypothetical protein
MIKIKISKKRMLENDKKSRPNDLNDVQKKNLNFLLLSKFEIGVGPQEDDISDEIISSIIDSEMDRTGNFDLYDNPPAALTAPKVMEDLVKKIKPLTHAKLIKAITGRSYGKIFKLDNEHILKIFFGGIDVKEDMEWYKKCHDLMHKKGAKLTTLPVYDYGEVKLKAMPDAFVAYVEMAEVEPLDIYLKGTKRALSDDSPGSDIVSKLQAYFIEAYYRENIKNIDGIKEYVKKRVNTFDSPYLYGKKDDDGEEGPDYGGGIYRPLTDEEASSILEAFYDMVKLGYQLSDIAPRNMGVLKQSSVSNPKIVIFDR